MLDPSLVALREEAHELEEDRAALLAANHALSVQAAQLEIAAQTTEVCCAVSRWYVCKEVHSTHAWGRLQEQALVALEELGSLRAAMHTVVRPALQAAKERRATVAQVGGGKCHLC